MMFTTCAREPGSSHKGDSLRYASVLKKPTGTILGLIPLVLALPITVFVPESQCAVGSCPTRSVTPVWVAGDRPVLTRTHPLAGSTVSPGIAQSPTLGL